jgi:hypothetical protein
MKVSGKKSENRKVEIKFGLLFFENFRYVCLGIGWIFYCLCDRDVCVIVWLKLLWIISWIYWEIHTTKFFFEKEFFLKFVLKIF